MHCTKISPEFEFGGQRSRSPGTKKIKKCGISSGAVLGGASCVVCQFYAGGIIHACAYCLVIVLYIIFCLFLYFSLIPSLYSSLKSEGHSFVSDEVVSIMINVTFMYIFICGCCFLVMAR